MDKSYLVWLGIAAIGAVAGIFVKPRTVGIFAVSLFVVCIAGLILNIALGGRESFTWLFGLGAMGMPVIGGLAFGGAAASDALIRSKTRRTQSTEAEKNDVDG